MTPLRVGYFGRLDKGGTCYSRMTALREIEACFYPCDVSTELTKPCRLTRALEHIAWLGPGSRKLNASLLRYVTQYNLNLVWIDKGTWVYRSTLRELKKRGVITVHHLTDALWPSNLWLKFTRMQLAATACNYTYFLTSNERDAATLKRQASGEILHTHLGYDERRFDIADRPGHPVCSSAQHEVVFVGHRENHTERGICELVDAGLPVSVFGQNWVTRSRQNRKLAGRAYPALGDDDYVSILRSAKIGLCFVSAWNYNETAGRSYEIPACGTFLLAQRTNGHRAHYVEGLEAEFFSSGSELVKKVARYLTNGDARKAIAAAGYKRCVTSGYTWREIMRRDWTRIRETLDRYYIRS